MEKIILGLLMLKGMSIYEMKTSIGRKMNSMCSSSAGSIHTAIRLLQKKGFIECTEEGRKKIYYITNLGREEFNGWLLQPMNREKAKNIEASKFFFMGMVEPEKAKVLITEYITGLKQEMLMMEELLHVCTENTEQLLEGSRQLIETDRWNAAGIKKNLGERAMEQVVEDIYTYQVEVLKYAVDFLKFETDWYTGLYKRMNEK